jgi:hypothetical protein
MNQRKSDPDHLDVLLAWMHVKHAGRSTGIEGASMRQKQSTAWGDDASDKASSLTEVNLVAYAPPPTKCVRVRVDPGGVGKAWVLREECGRNWAM